MDGSVGMMERHKKNEEEGRSSQEGAKEGGKERQYVQRGGYVGGAHTHKQSMRRAKIIISR